MEYLLSSLSTNTVRCGKDLSVISQKIKCNPLSVGYPMTRASQGKILSRGLLIGLLASLVWLHVAVAKIQSSPARRLQLRAWWKGARYIGEENVVRQPTPYDCGAAALAMVLASHGVSSEVRSLDTELHTTTNGTSLYNLRTVALAHGLAATSWKLRPQDLASAPYPLIVLVDRRHFIVVDRLLPGAVEVRDPAMGRMSWTSRSFLSAWSGETLVFDRSWSPNTSH